MNKDIYGPFKIDENDLNCFDSLEISDIDRDYILVCNCIHFVDSKEDGMILISKLSQ